MNGLISELKRRNVFRVVTAYVVSGWVVVQVVDLATEAFAAPSWVMQMTIALLVAGFIPALIVSCAFELTPEGLKRESELADQPAAARYTGQRLNIAVIVLLLVAIALLLADRFLFARQSIPRCRPVPGNQSGNWTPSPSSHLPISAPIVTRTGWVKGLPKPCSTVGPGR